MNQALSDPESKSRGRAPKAPTSLSSYEQSVEDDKVAEVIRAMIREETEQISRRITWFSQLQGLLFAAIGFAWGKSTGQELVQIIATLGAVTSLLVFLALIGPNRAIYSLTVYWSNRQLRNSVKYNGPGVLGYGGNMLFSPTNVIPIAFFIAWVAILMQL